jgi:hypothetical protein
MRTNFCRQCKCVNKVEFFEGNKSENNKTKERVLISIISLSSKTKSFDERTNEELKVK